MKAYKGFDKNLSCRGFRYEVGKEYKEAEAELCKSGFHSCINPLDVLYYYSPVDRHGNLNRYCEVDIPQNSVGGGNDSKVAAEKIKIKSEIGLCGLVEAAAEFISDDCTSVTKTERQSLSAVKDYRCAAVNTGDRSVSAAKGDLSVAVNTGDQSVAVGTGIRSVTVNSGFRSVAVGTGNQSVAINTDDQSVTVNIGNQSVAVSTGYYASASVEGTDSIAFAVGSDSHAKGTKDCWLVLTERDSGGYISDIKAVKVDGKKIKENTYYRLKKGEILKDE